MSAMRCPNCGRGFNCAGDADCWCLKVERVFDYEAYILRTGTTSCVCPVCLTGAEPAPDDGGAKPAPRRRGGRRGRTSQR